MIKITDIAKAKMISVLDSEKMSFLRFGLKGGGCSGFSYFFAIEKIRADDDFEIMLDNIHTLVIDPTSNMYLENAEVDYKKDLMGENFVFNNSLQKSTCGCGASVSFD